WKMFGATRVARIAITTITTRISISVNPERRARSRERRREWRGIFYKEGVVGARLDTGPVETVFTTRFSRETWPCRTRLRHATKANHDKRGRGDSQRRARIALVWRQQARNV